MLFNSVFFYPATCLSSSCSISIATDVESSGYCSSCLQEQKIKAEFDDFLIAFDLVVDTSVRLSK